MTRRFGWGVAGAACALVPGLAMWGFTVDDALIAVRYAENLAAGAGYRFDAGGPSTDGVTPLPWAPLLAVLAWVPPHAREPLDLLVRAKVLGLGAWVVAALALGAAVGERAERSAGARVAAAIALVTLALAFPVGAWAASGMETGVATALATLAAVSFARPARAAALAGIAAAFRPELLPWALVVGVGAALGASPSSTMAWPAAARAAAIASAPFAACSVLRLAFFGRPAPLAVLAKPSDLEHGLVYAAAASVVVLLPLVTLAPVAVARGGGRALALALAALVHLATVAAVGGDWMPYARLLVPIVPSLVLVVVDSAERGSRISRALLVARGAAAMALGVLLAARAAPAGRGVMRDRAALVREARLRLAGARVVAALDIGWVSAATEARLVDLAGLTDPTIASLGGGHTSKRVDLAMLLARDVDTILVYSEPRVVERRLLATPLFRERFEDAGALPFGTRGASYRIYRRVPPR